MKSKKDHVAHLRKDPVLRKVIDKVGPLTVRKESDLYVALLRAIVGQQLSVKAAATIWSRFLALFKDGYPDPKKLLKMKDEKLRKVGLSYQKASYVKNIAAFSLEKSLDYSKLKKMEDEVLIEYLVSIKGVGRWTVEMILMFSLDRPDIFPKDDLGIVNGIKMLYGINSVTKKELFAEMDRVAETWKPCRTLACRYLWRYKDAMKE